MNLHEEGLCFLFSFAELDQGGLGPTWNDLIGLFIQQDNKSEMHISYSYMHLTPKEESSSLFFFSSSH
jgi:hypothetical protein